MRGVLTLTTDFGTASSWVAEMKLVVLGLVDPVHFVDVTHEVPRHDVLAGALALEAVAAVSRPGTVHLAVVDPGVGTARRGLVVEADGQYFVGPDNGLATPLFRRARTWSAFELRARRYRRQAVSSATSQAVAPTFHGRDVFAPAAGHLLLGVAPERFGPRVLDPVTIPWPVAVRGRGRVRGSVIAVDQFGNLVSSITAADLSTLGEGPLAVVGPRGRRVDRRRRLRVVRTYGDLSPGEPGALVGSSGRLEVAVREASAARLLGIGRGATLSVVVARTRQPVPPRERAGSPRSRTSRSRGPRSQATRRAT